MTAHRIHSRKPTITTAVIAAAMFATIAVGSLSSCTSSRIEAATKATGGNPRLGREKISRYGCPACHEIPGIRTATGRVGPPLDHVAGRTFLAGEVPNTPENMIRWIQQPRAIEPNTAMPDMGVTDQDARDITAYLYSLD